jgi:hypothetical protein
MTNVDRLTGVYHANGSLRGELAYVVGKVFGRAHCALCDITHGAMRKRPEFVACAARLPVPFDLVHLDERAPDVRAATEGRTPCVVGHTASGLVVLLGPAELEACAKDPERLVDALHDAAAAHGLMLGSSDPR